jgi:hypothetical protein
VNVVVAKPTPTKKLTDSYTSLSQQLVVNLFLYRKETSSSKIITYGGNIMFIPIYNCNIALPPKNCVNDKFEVVFLLIMNSHLVVRAHNASDTCNLIDVATFAKVICKREAKSNIMFGS